ncbi:MAG: MerR family transcriptional regulator [Deltaproteobacteria bacterium]|nr:MerR family transcriptional regulator [Deltaproteobacteria bacterium]
MKKPPERYRIGAVERATGLTRDAIVLYVQEGLVPPPERESATVSWYGPAHLKRLGAVKALRREGLSLAQAARALRLLGDGVGPNDLVFLTRLLGTIENLDGGVSIEDKRFWTECLARVGLDGSMVNDPAVLAALGALRGSSDGDTLEALEGLRRRLEGAGDTPEALCRALLGVLRTEGPDAFLAQRAKVSRAAEAWREAQARRALEALVGALPGLWGGAALASYLPLGADGRREAERYLQTERLSSWQRLRALFGVSSAKALGAESLALAGGGWSWVAFGQGVWALDTRRHGEALGHFTEALERAPGWGLARALRASAGFLASAQVDDGRVPLALSALGDLFASAPSPDDPPVLRARTGWVLATLWRALPACLGGPPRALEACDQALKALGTHAEPDEVPGERPRLEGNLQLLRASLGDWPTRREALACAEKIAGPIAHAARALRRQGSQP